MKKGEKMGTAVNKLKNILKVSNGPNGTTKINSLFKKLPEGRPLNSNVRRAH